MSIPFTLEFEPLSARNGWMDCWITVNGDRQHVDASSVFAPFGDVLKFARAIATNQLPHEFMWHEEGPWLEFKAFPIQEEDTKFRLIIERNGIQILDTELNRMETVRGLVEELRGVALDCPGAESEWEFPYFLLESFELELARGLAVDLASNHISQARFVFYQCGGYGGVSAPAFCLWIDDGISQPMMMDDLRRLWDMWFEMLEKILHADFPFEYDFNRNLQPGDLEEGEEPYELWTWDSWDYFQADTTTDPGLFRLKIECEMKINGERTEVCTVTLNRHQFVSAFVLAFKEFLKTDYYGFLERGENKIDMRTLPLERLET